MKITTTQTTNKFNPVAFTVTCESQDELDFWTAIFDSTAITSAAMKAFGVSFGTSDEIGVYGDTDCLTDRLKTALKNEFSK